MTPFLVCDFDGTVCLADVGDRFFEHFTPPARRAEWQALIHGYETGAIGSRECLTREAALLTLAREDAEAFADGFHADPGFARLHDACVAQGIGIAVVSDGLDVYIRRILARAGLHDVEVLANRAVFEPGGALRPEFPWAGLGCGRCGNCKGYHVKRLQDAHHPVVMIGDAHSDVCGALAADRVFARPILARLLDQRGVACERFHEFDQIAAALGLAVNGKTP